MPIGPAGEYDVGIMTSSVVSLQRDAQEYDPAHPNDFEEVRKAREVQRKEAELEAQRQERIKLEAHREEVTTFLQAQVR